MDSATATIAITELPCACPCPFERDLTSYDSDLLRYPQRAVDFDAAGCFLFSQDMGSIGTTLWDAEIVLAHSLEADGVNGAIMELGCGCGLAAMVSARLGCGAVAVQELSEVIPYTTEVFRNNQVEGATFLAAKWGTDFCSQISALGISHSFDYVVMADVLYHCTDFDDLIASISSCTKPGSKVYICFEQRRRNLDDFFSAINKILTQTGVLKYVVVNNDSGKSTVINLLKFKAD